MSLFALVSLLHPLRRMMATKKQLDTLHPTQPLRRWTPCRITSTHSPTSRANAAAGTKDTNMGDTSMGEATSTF